MVGGSVSQESSSLRFRLLGPVEAWRNGHQLRLGGERQRALLACLLLRSNELVTTDRLVEELFGSDAHEDGLRSLRVAVSRLRRLLEDGDGAGVLVTRPGGYQLRLDPGQLDITEFEGLLRDGRREAGEGDLLSASVTLREALALWRGPPLADLSGLEFVQSDIRRLEELRVAGLMDRIEADLALGRHAQVVGELEALVAEHPLQERARGQLMLALYRSGRQAEALAVYRDTSDLLREELGLEPSRALQDLERAILQQAPELDLGSSLSPAPAGPVCPFKGLASFERGDADYFCGREALVTDLVALAASSGLVGLVGPSGVGKSSALRAGLLAALAGGALPGSAGWPQVVLRPGADPGGALGRALGGRTLPEALDELDAGQRLVVAIDQFEELFTAGSGPEAGGAFLSSLVAGAEDRERCLVVVALRADFYGRSVWHPEFARRLNRSHVLVGPMDRAELRRAIEEPSARAGLEVEPALTEALVSDVTGEPGGLPLLSTTLLELWQARQGNVLSYESYRDRGGVGGAVARLAESAYQSLDGADRDIARALLLRLTTGDEASLVRRRVPLAELAGGPAERRVVGLLTAERLMTVSDDEVEISHEALIREWPRYRDWVGEDRVARRLHAHLRAQAREWDGRGRDAADLYRGARLTAALEWSSSRGGEIGAVEREFLEASEEQAEADARQQRARNRRLRGLLAGAGVLLVLAVVAIIVAVNKQQSASDAARIARADSLGAQAIDDPHLDQAMLLAVAAVRLDPSEQTQGDLLTTVLRAPTAMRTLHGDNLRVNGMAISPDGHTLALEDNVPNILFLDASTGRRVGEVPTARLAGPPSVLAFSPDGRLVIFGGANPPNQVDLIDPTSGVVSQRLTFPNSVQHAIEPATTFSPSPNFGGSDFTFASGGHRMAVAVAGFAVQWSLPRGSLAAKPFRVPDGAGLVLYTDHGRRLISVANTRTSVLDARTGQVLRSYGVGGGAAAVSGDGHTMIFGEANGSVRFLDLGSGAITTAVAAHDGQVNSVAFTPDGRTAITSGDDGRSRVWDVGSHQVTRTLAGNAGGIYVQAVSTDGRTLYTGGNDGNALAWDLSGRRGLAPSFQAAASNPAAGAWNVAITPDARLLAVGGTDGTVNVWSTGSLRKITSFRAGPGEVAAVSFAPDGHSLLVAGDAQQPAPHPYMGVWEMGPRPRLLHALRGLNSFITWATFSPDGGVVAATGANSTGGSPLTREGVVAEWSTRTGRLLAQPTTLPPDGDAVVASFARKGTTVAVGQLADRLDMVNPAHRVLLRRWKDSAAELTAAAAVAPDGRRVATADNDGFLRVWSAAGRPELSPIRASELEVNSVNWSPDGTRLVTAGGDGTVRLYDATSGQQIGTSLPIPNPASPYATYSANGHVLAVTDATGRVWLYPASAAGWESYACRVANRSFSRSEWAKFVPGQTYRPVCSASR